MGLTFREPCPVCNALVAYENAASLNCPHCGSELVVGNSDPTWHDISEIDPDILGGGFGEFHLNLHPVGTHICVQCQQIYPTVFECCPGRVDVALAAYETPDENWGPKTQSRIRDFLLSNPKVVANTAQLRILQSHYREKEPELGVKIKNVLQALELGNVIEQIADELE